MSNEHCFFGFGYQYWSAIARGMRPVGDQRKGHAALVNSRDGYRVAFEADTDGYAVQNGGMFNPQLVDLSLYGEHFYRFFNSVSINKYGINSGFAGGWWVNEAGFSDICDYATRLDWPLARAAAHILIIPKEWGDCAYVGKARLVPPVWAFRGKGKPATTGGGDKLPQSPDHKDRQKDGVRVVMGALHLQVMQYFVPGSEAELKAAFTRVGVCHVIKQRPSIDFT